MGPPSFLSIIILVKSVKVLVDTEIMAPLTTLLLLKVTLSIFKILEPIE
jgi:hypothetical protein